MPLLVISTFFLSNSNANLFHFLLYFYISIYLFLFSRFSALFQFHFASDLMRNNFADGYMGTNTDSVK